MSWSTREGRTRPSMRFEVERRTPNVLRRRGRAPAGLPGPSGSSPLSPQATGIGTLKFAGLLSLDNQFPRNSRIPSGTIRAARRCGRMQCLRTRIHHGRGSMIGRAATGPCRPLQLRAWADQVGRKVHCRAGGKDRPIPASSTHILILRIRRHEDRKFTRFSTAEAGSPTPSVEGTLFVRF